MAERTNINLDLWYLSTVIVSLGWTYVVSITFGVNSFGKINFSRFFQSKCIRNHIWSCHKVGQGQHRTIIWSNMVRPTSLKLHIKTEGHQLSGFGEEEFLPYMSVMAILVTWPELQWTLFLIGHLCFIQLFKNEVKQFQKQYFKL